MGVSAWIGKQSITPTVKVGILNFLTAVIVFIAGLLFGRGADAGRFQMFHGISTVARSEGGVTRYEKEDSVFLIDTKTGEIRKYAHDSVGLAGKTVVYEGWNAVLRPIREDQR